MTDNRLHFDKALETLKAGGVILHQTDTIWGLGCDATNPAAINKIMSIKKRDPRKTFIVLLSNPDDIGRYVHTIPEVAFDLIECADSPLTIVYPGGVNLPKELIAEDGSVAIRIVKDELCSELLRRFRKPLASTSANISGQASAVDLQSVPSSILNEVDYVLPLTRPEKNNDRASRIIKLQLNGEFRIIR